MPAPEIRARIEREAAEQGVPPDIALAFAELESGFNPRAFGDRDWASRHPSEWNELRHRMPNNPAIADPAAWGSYGLFGLLAAYHVKPDEHPHALWDEAVNATRGVSAIRRALQRANGDASRARLLYVGCGLDGSLCSARTVARINARLERALQHWREGTPASGGSRSS